MIKTTIVNNLKKRFLTKDGAINKTVVASLITLLIVLVQQVLAACGITYGSWDQVVAVINTLLTILALLGFCEGDGEVAASGEKHQVKAK